MLVVFSATSRKPGLVNALDIIFRNVAIRGFWLDSPAFCDSPKVLEAMKTGVRLIAEGKLHGPFAVTYPLATVKEAFAYAQNGEKMLFNLS